MKIFAPFLTIALCIATLSFATVPSMAQSPAARKRMHHHAVKTAVIRKAIRHRKAVRHAMAHHHVTHHRTMHHGK